MAKQTSIIKLQGTFKDVTFVSSSAYGNHVRAKRGTYKPAPLNASMKREAKMVLKSNVPAKIFKDAIDPYRYESRGKLWQRLVSTFRKQLKTGGKFDFTKLPPFDVYETYPLQKFLTPRLTVKSDKKKSSLQVDILYDEPPKFRRCQIHKWLRHHTDRCVPGREKRKKAQTTVATSPIQSLTGSINPLVITLNVPRGAKEYVVCLKLEGCEKDVVIIGGRMTTALCAIVDGAI